MKAFQIKYHAHPRDHKVCVSSALPSCRPPGRSFDPASREQTRLLLLGG